MGLMIIEPLDDVLAEAARLLRPGGRMVALLPSTSPLTARDRVRHLRLQASLRHRFGFPNDRCLERPSGILAAAGFALEHDERRRFEFQLDTPEAAELYVRSLYLPGALPTRAAAGVRTARRWEGSTLGIPLRLLVAHRLTAVS